MSALRLDRQVSAPGFDQRALDQSTLVLVGRRDSPVTSVLAFLGTMMGIPTVVADDSLPLPALDEDAHLALDAAPEVMRLDVSLDLARAMMPGLTDNGWVTVIADAASHSSDFGGFGVTPTWVATTDGGALVTRDFSRAKMLSQLTTGKMPAVVAHQVAATLLGDHIARAKGYADTSGKPMPKFVGKRGQGRWFGAQSLSGPFLPQSGPLDVHIIGQGGLGSAVLRLLVRSVALHEQLRGGTLTLTDYDQWTESNYNRVTTTDRSALFQPKATTNARYAQERLAGLGMKIIADVNHFDATSLTPGAGPHVIIAATDSLESRRDVIHAAREYCPSALVIYAGADFTFGSVRGYVHDHDLDVSLCFAHGPESIDTLVEEADAPDPFGGCTALGQPANILTNMLVACGVLEILAAWRARGAAPAHQHLVSWMHADRMFRGPEIQVGCECAEELSCNRCFEALEEALACNR